MKLLAIPAVMALLTGSTFAHSWLECVDTKVENKEYAKAHPSATLKQTCKGSPRNKVHNGDWIAESTYYSYNFNTKYACRDNQRVPGQTAPGAPMATATPGEKLTMRFWGNGHSRWDIGSPNHRDPGLVRIFWAGKPETEIVYAKDLNEKYWIPGAQGNFSGDAVTEITGNHMNEKANYFEFTVPEKIQNGRHMMVWAWAWKASMVDGKHGNPNVYDESWDNAWGTCFDLQIVNSKYTEAANPDILNNQKGYSDAKMEKKLETTICSKTCLRGGIKGQECTGSSCPPCWYKNEGQINCFDYTSGTTCPFPNAWDCKKGGTSFSKREAEEVHNHAKKHRRNNKL
ncbi:hypothetical protein K440DRAFT_663937 [Wilcoxina mikolae CBS 423.85]|nr:hypothetical protein K440DRAFT_663937 [Wilcoxina mikolae CBS 423.85]